MTKDSTKRPWDIAHVLFLDPAAGYTDVFTLGKLMELYTYALCTFLCVPCTSIESTQPNNQTWSARRQSFTKNIEAFVNISQSALAEMPTFSKCGIWVNESIYS